MTKIVREVWIDAPRQDVWDKALVDFGSIYAWNPNVPKSYLTSEKTGGVGVTRHCDLNIEGASLEERVTHWEEGRMMKISIYDGKKLPPWKNPTAKIELFDENGGTKVRGTFEYDMKMGPVGSLMNTMMIKPNFGKAWGLLHIGMKHFVENGQKAENKEQLDLSKVTVVV